MHKQELRSLICSMLLGDGCLSYGKDPGYGRRGNPKPHDVFYAMNHSSLQQDYAFWKAQLLDNIFIKQKVSIKCTYAISKKHDKKYNKVYYGVYVKLRWAKFFRPLREKAYWQIAEKTHLKNIEYLLDNINLDLHTAIWFMDDGNEKRKKRKSVAGVHIGYDNPFYRLFTFGYTAGQHQLIREWFIRKYDVYPRICTQKDKPEGKNLFLAFTPSDSKKLFLVLHPYFSQTDSMKNKFWLSFARYKPEKLETPQLEVDDIVQTTTSKTA